MNLHPETIIGDCLETAFGLPIYTDIIITAKNSDNFDDVNFRKKFNGYYRVRQRKPEWYDCYYKLLENQRKNKLSFEEILKRLLPFGTLEVSFSSKLISTIDTHKPIWDQYVLKNLGFFDEWNTYKNKTKNERLEKAVEIYGKIEMWYKKFLNSSDGKKCIEVFDLALPKYKNLISDEKKIDFLLVSKR